MERYEHEEINEQFEKLIDDKLSKLSLKPLRYQKESIATYLRKIEAVIQTYEEERKQALRTYKENKISILKISKNTGIARQTIYNNRASLEGYINKSIELQKKQDIFERVAESLKTLDELKADIFKLQLRDVNIEKQSLQIEEMSEVIKKNNKVIENLSIRNQELINKVNELNGELNKYKVKKIEFNKDQIR